MKSQDDSLQKELIELETRYWNAIKNQDADTATRLSDDTCVVVGAQGVGELDRKALAGMLNDASYQLRKFTLDDVHMHRVSDDVVALAYKVKEKLTVDGEAIDLEAFDSSVWVHRNGHWVCAVHTESLAGDPFGRHH